MGRREPTSPWSGCGWSTATPARSTKDDAAAGASRAAFPTGDSGPLCDRTKAIADVSQRFGPRASQVVAALNLFCNGGRTPVPGPTQHWGDTYRVTCTHDATLRDKLPALQQVPPRYVVWGEGTSDEMCLGILIVS